MIRKFFAALILTAIFLSAQSVSTYEKHTYDKRAALHEKSAKRDVERALKERSR